MNFAKAFGVDVDPPALARSEQFSEAPSELEGAPVSDLPTPVSDLPTPVRSMIADLVSSVCQPPDLSVCVCAEDLKQKAFNRLNQASRDFSFSADEVAFLLSEAFRLENDPPKRELYCGDFKLEQKQRENEQILRLAVFEWCASQNASPTSFDWTQTSQASGSLFMRALEIWPLCKPPAAAFAFLGIDRPLDDTNADFHALLHAREWTPRELGEALARIAKNGFAKNFKIQALTDHCDAIPTPFLEFALFCLCALPRSHTSASDRESAPIFARAWIENLGVAPKGPTGDGVYLRWALKNQRWQVAKEIDQLGGMGPDTVAWLLAPRKRDPEALEPWKRKALALKEAAIFQKTIFGQAACPKATPPRSIKKTKQKKQKPNEGSAPGNPRRRGAHRL